MVKLTQPSRVPRWHDHVVAQITIVLLGWITKYTHTHTHTHMYICMLNLPNLLAGVATSRAIHLGHQYCNHILLLNYILWMDMDSGDLYYLDLILTGLQEASVDRFTHVHIYYITYGSYAGIAKKL